MAGMKLPLLAGRRAAKEETSMPSDTMTLMGLGIGAVLIAWLVFSVVKKVFGIALLLALAAGAWLAWSNPELRSALMGFAGPFLP